MYKCFEDLMRGVWVADVRKLRENGLGVLVEDVGWQECPVLAGILERSRGEVQALRDFVGAP
jgi:hypothetical protein